VTVGQSMERQHDYSGASRAYAKALAEQPADVALRTRLAFVLVRDGQAARAADLVRPTARGGVGDDRAEALLVLGLAQWELHLPQAAATLRLFERLSPGNPAVPEVDRLLKEAS
jgi:hypothetical protein